MKWSRLYTFNILIVVFCLTGHGALHGKNLHLELQTGHGATVNALAISPDGKRMLSGASDRTLRLWDLHLKQTLHTLKGHTKAVKSVVFSLDGKRALSGSADKTLRLWDLKTGKTIHILKGHRRLINSVAFSADGTRALSGSDDRTLRLWDLKTGKTIHVLKGHKLFVTSVAFHPDGTRALSGSSDKTLRWWDLKTGKTLKVLKGHRSYVTSVAIFEEGRRALSSAYDASVRLWDLDSGKPLRVLKGQRKRVEKAVFVPHKQQVLSTDTSGNVTLWDLNTGKALKAKKWIWNDHMVISPNGQFVVASSYNSSSIFMWTPDLAELTTISHGSGNRDIRLSAKGDASLSLAEDKIFFWNLKTGTTEQQALPSKNLTMQGAAYSRDTYQILALSADNTFHLWSLGKYKNLRMYKGIDPFDLIVNEFVAFPKHPQVYKTVNQTVELFNVGTDKRQVILKGHLADINAVDFSADGRLAITGSADKTIRIWDLGSGKTVRILKGHTGAILSVALSPDGQLALSGSNDQTTRLWEVDTGEPQLISQKYESALNLVSFADIGGGALIGSTEKNFFTWNLNSGAVKRRLGNSSMPKQYFSNIYPDQRLAATKKENVLYFSQLGTGKLVKAFDGHTSRVGEYILSPDKKQLLIAYWDRSLRLWDFETKKLLQVMECPGQSGIDVVFSADGRQLVSATSDNKGSVDIRLWDLSTGKLIRQFKPRGMRHSVHKMAMTPDGILAASSGDQSNRIWLWNANTGKLLNRFFGLKSEIAFSRDGKVLITADQDGTIRFRNAKTGKLIATGYSTRSSEWCVVTPNGEFDHSSQFPLVWSDGSQTYPISEFNAEKRVDNLLVKRLKPYQL